MNATSSLTILTNSFHRTEYRTRKTRDELEVIERRVDCGSATDAERSLLTKIRRTLCGIDGCTCARNSYGERS